LIENRGPKKFFDSILILGTLGSCAHRGGSGNRRELVNEGRSLRTVEEGERGGA